MNIYIVFLLILLIILFYYAYLQNKLEGMSALNDSTEPLSNEAIQNVSSLYNKDNMTVSNINVTGTATVQGDTTIGGNAKINNISLTNGGGSAGVVTGEGRLHIDGPEILYLLNKSGVIIGKEWGGNGNLSVEGDLAVSGNLAVGGSLTIDGVVISSNGEGLIFRHPDGTNFQTMAGGHPMWCQVGNCHNI